MTKDLASDCELDDHTAWPIVFEGPWKLWHSRYSLMRPSHCLPEKYFIICFVNFLYIFFFWGGGRGLILFVNFVFVCVCNFCSVLFY